MVAEAASKIVNRPKPIWNGQLARYAHAVASKSWRQLFDTLVPYCGALALMYYTIRQGYSYWLTLALSVLAAGVLVRVFILFHDCCHGSFFKSRKAHTVLGYVTGVLTFTPYEDWRYAHNIHHATAGDLDRRGFGDIWTITKAEYLAMSRLKRLGYRIYRHPFILFGPGSALLFLLFQRFTTRGGGKKERRSVLITNLALLAIAAAASATIGLRAYLLIQTPVILIAGMLGLWLFYLQHQYERVYWARHEDWDVWRVALEGSSYLKLPRVLQWFSGNIGLHHIHHARPTIPNYNLQQCYDEIPTFQTVKPLTLRCSFKTLRLALYDEEQRRLIGFRGLIDSPDCKRRSAG